MNRQEAINEAREKSKNGYSQHACIDKHGEAFVSDWYDCDTTFASFMNGEYL